MTGRFVKTFLLDKARSYYVAALLFSIPFIAVGTMYDRMKYGLLLSCIAFFIATVLIILKGFEAIRFCTMIKNQETSLNVKISDSSFTHVCGFVYISDSWLVYAGRFALHKNNIKSVSSRKKHSLTQRYSQIVEVISTLGKKYQFTVLSADKIEIIKAISK